MKNTAQDPVHIVPSTDNSFTAQSIPQSIAPIKRKLEKYSRKNPWLVPAGIAFALGLAVAIAGNLLFSSQFETIGIIVGSILSLFFLALLALLFYVLHQNQQRARWEQDNFQLAIKAELENRRSQQLSEDQRKQQEATALLDLLTRTVPIPQPGAPVDTRIGALVQKAMSLAADDHKSLAEKFQSLQEAVAEMKNTPKS